MAAEEREGAEGVREGERREIDVRTTSISDSWMHPIILKSDGEDIDPIPSCTGSEVQHVQNNGKATQATCRNAESDMRLQPRSITSEFNTTRISSSSAIHPCAD